MFIQSKKSLPPSISELSSCHIVACPPPFSSFDDDEPSPPSTSTLRIRTQQLASGSRSTSLKSTRRPFITTTSPPTWTPVRLGTRQRSIAMAFPGQSPQALFCAAGLDAAGVVGPASGYTSTCSSPASSQSPSQSPSPPSSTSSSPTHGRTTSLSLKVSETGLLSRFAFTASSSHGGKSIINNNSARSSSNSSFIKNRLNQLSSANDNTMGANSTSLSLTIHAAGLIVVYSLYGVLQEKIMRGTYGEENAKFTSSSLLILFNRIFSVATGLFILFLKSPSVSRTAAASGAPSFSARLRPKSSLFAYAAVALSNFLSTTCQYEALKYVSYTTQSLAKCAKMVPVLVVGALVYRKKHQTKEWVAGGVIVAGCALYLFSHPPTSKHHHAAADDGKDSLWSGILGTLFLCGYLFFDGLVSTTQERVFGKNPSSSDPFGPESPVLDQMIWTNIFAGLIATITALATNVTGTLWPNVQLLLTSPSLLWDVCVFSGASALGLIILLNTIASFGALTCSLVMTTRQFLSILLNAGIFGNFRSVGIEGWTGVGWVASGIFIKMNKKFDPPKPAKGAAGDAVHSDELLGLAAKEGFSLPASEPKKNSMRQHFYQYVVPISVPVVLAFFFGPMLLATPGASSSSSTPTSIPTKSAQLEAGVNVQGGRWSHELHSAFSPSCEHNITTEVYNGNVRTGFVSYPRSGNSYLRSLIERATGYQTSSIYCDKGLRRTFLGECDHKTTFFVKTHFPALPKKMPGNSADYYKRFDQTVHLVRNPLDSVASWWHLDNSPRTAEGFQDHENRIDVKQFGPEHRLEMLDLARRWRDHAIYWQQAPILTHTLRYEDLRSTPIPKMMSLLSFLLPSADLPSLTDLACMVEDDTSHEAYTSRKNSDFSTWDIWAPDLRMEILELVRRPFCAFGYDRLLSNKMGDLPEMKNFCSAVSYDDMDDDDMFKRSAKRGAKRTLKTFQ
ncbi:UAA-domain-containing protein [Meredithblackwellia eburnea MCA 4105]